MEGLPPAVIGSDRSRRWAATMAGHRGPGLRTAHADSTAAVGTKPVVPLDREDREGVEDTMLAVGATRARGGGRRAVAEEADAYRTCFERDRDRILHSSAFRRLAGKTQVFIFPADHQRTRLTHALEVAQVATGIARACRLNVALTEAIALGHDCGHGPGGHASEDALGIFLTDGFDHAVWGADVSVADLNLCLETLDGIRNHSWSRPAPSTPEGEVVSWADRIAYVCHDWEDAVSAGIVTPAMLPDIVRQRCGETRSHQLRAFIQGMTGATLSAGRVGMDEELAEALASFRQGNYEHVYFRPASVAQGAAVVAMLRDLVEHFADQPNRIPGVQEMGGLAGGSADAVQAAVAYVAGMTDRFAMASAVGDLGWDPRSLPRGIDDVSHGQNAPLNAR
ncbi:MAG TPA: HD domain-containing protein [Acidimicrobiales bacterium]|nr:HD domain-containing protein [Acidimicrobiales bacterium]